MKYFKNILFILGALLLLQSCIVSAKPNIGFFSDKNYDFEEAKFASFNVPVFLAKPFIRKALKEDDDSREVAHMVSKVSKIKIMAVENGSEKMLKDYAVYLRKDNYEDWATIKHDDENINIRVKQNGETIKKMLITVNSGKEMIFLDIRGSFTPKDISKMIAAANNNKFHIH